MPRSTDRDRGRRASGTTTARPSRGGAKGCQFCAANTVWIDYKDIATLRRFTSDRGKIRAGRVSGTCAQHQREVTIAVKTARELALLPYSERTTAPGRAPRGSRGDRGPRATLEPAGPDSDGPHAGIDQNEPNVDAVADGVTESAVRTR